NRLLLTG
nr:Chain B, Substrate Peptide (7 Residues) [synthetic construct]1DKY_C Chain C, PEPTIDE SUBSTRATE1DKY_D Chain D, PEPTIDE SUBSTRATE1DKZ_B Chain B, Substrate Peptide (7 Residues) [synthetic construct]1Q5L_B Chain B, peptide NRLLLTG [synthetic construct]4EZW_E Chain E, synthetic peptide NRLLLTG [synthetic construct]4EZW_F Chain F, synthetic peptide NRLLLTG [synthetic construct]4EZW_G Chain G, synthetic peptide NRLLLTG [synthetic construct]4EZW_H Chain H, synthetic peptide NRLLLTG [synthetic co